jgi:hypothetical protein
MQKKEGQSLLLSKIFLSPIFAAFYQTNNEVFQAVHCFKVIFKVFNILVLGTDPTHKKHCWRPLLAVSNLSR